MGGVYWVLAIIIGLGYGIGLAFLIMALILNKSNNLGDSRSKKEDYASGILYFSQQDRMSPLNNAFMDYVETNLELLVSSRDYRSHCETAIKCDARKLVERYIPGQEKEEEQPIFANQATAATASAPQASQEVGQESEWAAARRRNMEAQSQATSDNPWGDENPWGETPSPWEQPAPSEPASASADDPWGGLDVAAPAAAATSAAADPWADPKPESAAPELPNLANPDSPFKPLGSEPIYEAPTATRPLWENTNSNDDFSDFDDM